MTGQQACSTRNPSDHLGLTSELFCNWLGLEQVSSSSGGSIVPHPATDNACQLYASKLRVFLSSGVKLSDALI